MPTRKPGEPYTRISVDEARKMLGSPDVYFVDVRRSDEYEEGHVSGSVHIPVDDVLERSHELPKDKKLLFICAAGVRSGLACEMAAAMGFPDEILFNVEDGTPVWLERNYPATMGSQPGEV